MLGSPDPRCRMEEWRFVPEEEVDDEWWVEERWMSELEERRRENRPERRVGDATGAGGGEGSRRPKRGILKCIEQVSFDR